MRRKLGCFVEQICICFSLGVVRSDESGFCAPDNPPHPFTWILSFHSGESKQEGEKFAPYSHFSAASNTLLGS
jgi:hypothetical protein